MSKHTTPGPWKVVPSVNCDGFAVDQLDKRKPYIADDLSKDDAKRIVDCVNAMAGIDDPADFVQKFNLLKSTITKISELKPIQEGGREACYAEAHKLANQALLDLEGSKL